MAQREHIYNSKDFHLTDWHYKYFFFICMGGKGKVSVKLQWKIVISYLCAYLSHLQASDHQTNFNIRQKKQEYLPVLLNQKSHKLNLAKSEVG